MATTTAAEHMIKLTRMTIRYRQLRGDGKIDPLPFFDSGNLTRGRSEEKRGTSSCEAALFCLAPWWFWCLAGAFLQQRV